MSKQNSEFQYKSSLILWSAFLLAQSTFFVILYGAKPNLFKFSFSQPFFGENFVTVAVFGFMAIMNLFISLFLKAQAVENAIESQQPKLLQQGVIIGCAFCESISILGLVLAFAFNYPYFFIWFFVGTVGMMLHYPKRQNFHDATFKK
jgi:hypothetical protein